MSLVIVVLRITQTDTNTTSNQTTTARRASDLNGHSRQEAMALGHPVARGQWLAYGVALG